MYHADTIAILLPSHGEDCMIASPAWVWVHEQAHVREREVGGGGVGEIRTLHGVGKVCAKECMSRHM
jgi:hypothetical protein